MSSTITEIPNVFSYDSLKNVCYVNGNKYRLCIGMTSTERRRRRKVYMQKYRKERRQIQLLQNRENNRNNSITISD